MSFVHRFELDSQQPVLRGHRMQGRCVLPGLAYVDLLYQSFAEQQGAIHQLVLRNLSIYSPLVLEDGQSVRLEAEWTQASPAAWSVVLQGGVQPGSAKDVRFAAAEMHVTDDALSTWPEQVVDIAAIRQRAHRMTDVGELYARCRANGLVHDAFMQASGCIWRDEDALYAELHLGDEASAQAEEALLHPALLDAAAVTLGLASQDEIGETQLFLPLFFDFFRARQALPTRCWVRARRDGIRQRHELRYITLEFLDADGRLIAELGNLTAKLLRETGLSAEVSTDLTAGVPTSPSADRDVTSPAPRQTIERYLCEQIAQQVGRPASAIGTDVGYYEMGLSSANLMQLGQILSRQVQRDLPPTLMFEYPTLRELADYLVEHDSHRFGASLTAQPVASSVGASDRSARVEARTSTARQALRSSTGLQEPVAIIGMEGRFPGAADLGALWAVLRDGVDCITEVPPGRWPVAPYFDAEKGRFGKTYSKWGGFIDDVAAFDPLFFGISPREAQVMDPQSRLLLETVWTLLESEGHTRESLQRTYKGRVGVYVGAMYQHYASLDPDPDWDAVASLTSYSAIANRVSHFFGFQGPSVAIDAMCSSAAMVIHQACKDLAAGECELAVAGGVNLSLHPKKFVGLSQAHLLGSHPGCRSFADGDGYLPSEGVAAVLLKPLSRARADGDPVVAVIRGTAALHAGRAQAYMAPNLAAQAQVMQQALQRAGLSPTDIGYVESAANGSALGDPIEVAALARVWAATPQARCALGSVKSNLGHPEAVSGMAQLAKVVLQMQHGQLAPLVGAYPINPDLRLDATPFTLQRELAPWSRPAGRGAAEAAPRRALINSFAAGGSYACLVVEEAPAVSECRPGESPTTDLGEQIIVCSARTPEQLKAVVRRLLDHAQHEAIWRLDELAYTLQVGREALPVRFATVVRTREQLLDVLREYLHSTQDRELVEPSSQRSYYCGDVDVDGPRLRQLLGNEQLGELIATLTARQDWHRVGALWAQGACVPWHRWTRVPGLRKLRLPTYPFAREHCWLPEGQASAGVLMPAQTPAQSRPMAERPDASPLPENGALSSRIEACIADFMRQVLAVSPSQFVAHRPLRDYGLDSILGLQLARHLSSRFGVAVTARAMLENPSAAALAHHLASGVDSSARAVEKPAAPASHGDAGLVAALEQFQRGELEMNDLKQFIERALAE